MVGGFFFSGTLPFFVSDICGLFLFYSFVVWRYFYFLDFAFPQGLRDDELDELSVLGFLERVNFVEGAVDIRIWVLDPSGFF